MLILVPLTPTMLTTSATSITTVTSTTTMLTTLMGFEPDLNTKFANRVSKKLKIAHIERSISPFRKRRMKIVMWLRLAVLPLLTLFIL